MAENEVQRRTILKAGAWSVPIIAAAAAVPARAASGDSDSIWSVTKVQAEYQRDPSDNTYYVHVGAEVTCSVTPTPSANGFTLKLSTGDSWIWYFGWTGSGPMSTPSDSLASTDATTLTITTPDGVLLGPYPIDRSGIF